MCSSDLQNPEIKLEFWAGAKHFPGEGSQYFLMHWAGEWQARQMDHYIHRILKKFRLTNVNPLRIRYFMPYRKLWKSYRDLNAEAVKKVLSSK